ncbi:hypothetical protein PR003_g21173 [Phytophthora rubi]|uniref:RxLR effector protein n=1 Tax=Phytophthora rubi TaxID=129364 RepID=A0A6A3NGD0_9STRA|nr:hypothetical protein PR002_g3790 [Phytophthora rubi]KAE9048362.1 hypothetical protein PR001_g3829 [Phytophthora rubi]KAE9306699.1 hypothetical protein PR003_g21173 [Phytophthora rubi]
MFSSLLLLLSTCVWCVTPTECGSNRQTDRQIWRKFWRMIRFSGPLTNSVFRWENPKTLNFGERR